MRSSGLLANALRPFFDAFFSPFSDTFFGPFSDALLNRFIVELEEEALLAHRLYTATFCLNFTIVFYRDDKWPSRNDKSFGFSLAYASHFLSIDENGTSLI